MLSPRAGLKQLEFPSAGRPMSSRSWRSTECWFGMVPGEYLFSLLMGCDGGRHPHRMVL